MYYQGEGVTKDYGQAVNWFRKGAEQGNADAQWRLGVMYNRGDESLAELLLLAELPYIFE